jgi:hypothetical protein
MRDVVADCRLLCLGFGCHCQRCGEFKPIAGSDYCLGCTNIERNARRCVRGMTIDCYLPSGHAGRCISSVEHQTMGELPSIYGALQSIIGTAYTTTNAAIHTFSSIAFEALHAHEWKYVCHFDRRFDVYRCAICDTHRDFIRNGTLIV